MTSTVVFSISGLATRAGIPATSAGMLMV